MPWYLKGVPVLREVAMAPSGRVRGDQNQAPTGFKDPSTLAKHSQRIVHVFDKVSHVDHVELVIGVILPVERTAVDLQPARSCHFDSAMVEIDSFSIPPKVAHLGQEGTTPAADI
jgi:hypothetical protein